MKLLEVEVEPGIKPRQLHVWKEYRRGVESRAEWAGTLLRSTRQDFEVILLSRVGEGEVV